MSAQPMPDHLQIDNRKDFLLLLLAACDGEPVVGVTRLLKYAFLLQMRYHWNERFDLADPYQFEAYNFGPFDSQIYDDLALLENAGLIQAKESAQPETRAERGELGLSAVEAGTSDPEIAPWEADNAVHEWSLTDKGRAFVRRYALGDEERSQLNEIKRAWNRRTLIELLRWLYREYPDFATETELTHLRPKVGL